VSTQETAGTTIRSPQPPLVQPVTLAITLIPGPNSVLNTDLPQTLERTRFSVGSSISDSKISVIVVAAERLFRLGLAGLLGEDERLDVIGVSDGEPELLGLCSATSVDVVLLDLELSRANGIDLVRLLASECSTTRTLVLTSNPDWRVRPAMIAGAAGVLLKDTSPEAIRAAVVSVHLGDHVLCNEAARWVLGEEPSTHLTHRESDVLRMVAQGANNAEIATQLHLGQKTVRNYVSRLYRKLDLNNRAQIATYLSRTDVARSASSADLATAENRSSVHSS
jgi:DNA-binding NarL/FixJ family response regulator